MNAFNSFVQGLAVVALLAHFIVFVHVFASKQITGRLCHACAAQIVVSTVGVQKKIDLLKRVLSLRYSKASYIAIVKQLQIRTRFFQVQHFSDWIRLFAFAGLNTNSQSI